MKIIKLMTISLITMNLSVFAGEIVLHTFSSEGNNKFNERFEEQAEYRLAFIRPGDIQAAADAGITRYSSLPPHRDSFFSRSNFFHAGATIVSAGFSDFIFKLVLEGTLQSAFGFQYQVPLVMTSRILFTLGGGIGGFKLYKQLKNHIKKE